MSDFGIELEGYRSPSLGRPAYLMSEKSYAEGSNLPIAVPQVISCSGDRG